MAPFPQKPLSYPPLEGRLPLLEPYLEPVDLPLRKVLEQKGRPFKAVYFPDGGFALGRSGRQESPSKSVSLVARV